MTEFSAQELYDVSLKATYPITIGSKTFQPGESIVVFDKIQIGQFQENRTFFSARGGKGNPAHIWWENTKDIKVYLQQGVFSKLQFSLMAGAKLIKKEDNEVSISRREKIETNELGVAQTKYFIAEPVYVYTEDGDKIDFTYENNLISTTLVYQDIIVDYQYIYKGKNEILSFGESLKGYLQLEGKTRVKDDITGQVKTGILKIPKLKLLSDLSMSLGKDANPLIGRLDAVAIPSGNKGEKRVMELYILDDDIDADIQ